MRRGGLRRILPAAGACAQTVKPGVGASKRNWGDPTRFLRWDCSLVSPCSHSSLGPDMPSASGNLTCAAVVTITMIEPHLDRRALRSVDSWAAQSLAMREAPISGATRPHFTANFGKANTSSPEDFFVPNFFGVCVRAMALCWHVHIHASSLVRCRNICRCCNMPRLSIG